MTPGMVMLRTRSHRARERLDRELGRHPQYFWTWEIRGLCEVHPHEVPKALAIKGITRARMTGLDPHPCIDWT